METNRIINELKAIAQLDWNPEQKRFYEQRAADARAIECVPMRDVFTPEQMRFLRYAGYRAQRKMCYKNATRLVNLIAMNCSFPEPVRYVEGCTFAFELLPIEHAFVKYGDKYIDPTFERALHRNVRDEIYASCIELDALTMAKYQGETGFYGELYLYDYLCKNRPELAAQMRARNPHNR